MTAIAFYEDAFDDATGEFLGIADDTGERVTVVRPLPFPLPVAAKHYRLSETPRHA